MLSPRGRCHAFDAGADGFVRGEGAGVVVLKRLTDAVRDGDRVLAVVRGSAVNQDGRSNGLTAPNTLAQRDVITRALRCADVAAGSVNFVETHGTGTALGDPIEFEALADVYGRGDGPCALGAVKTNIGPLRGGRRDRRDSSRPCWRCSEARFRRTCISRSGIRRSTRHRPGCSFPPTWRRGPQLRIRVEPRCRRSAWAGRTRMWCSSRARIRRRCQRSAGSAVTTLVVSGKTDSGSRRRRRGWPTGWKATAPAVPLADVAHTLNHHRPRTARSPRCARATARRRSPVCARWPPVSRHPAWWRPTSGETDPGTVFLYSGQGAQWAGMGQELLVEEPAFAAAVDELEPVFVEKVGFSLREVLEAGEPVVGIDRIQPVLVGMQLALTALWRSYGVEPDAVIGHSMGEVTAAVVAGALSPADGLKVIATRSRLMSRLSGQGAMALLELDATAAEKLIADLPRRDGGGVRLAEADGDRGPARAGRRGDRGRGRPGQAGPAHRGGRGIAPPDHRPDPARVAQRAGLFGADGAEDPADQHGRPNTGVRRRSTPTTGRPTCATRCGSARPWTRPAPTTARSSRSARIRCSPTRSPRAWGRQAARRFQWRRR